MCAVCAYVVCWCRRPPIFFIHIHTYTVYDNTHDTHIHIYIYICMYVCKDSAAPAHARTRAIYKI